MAREALATMKALATICIATISFVGCHAAKQAVGVLGDLQAVSEEVTKATGHPTVRVNLVNGHALSIGMVNSPFGTMADTERRAKAREIAVVAYRAFKSRADLDSVSVSFVVQRQYLLFFNYTNALNSFVFRPSELEPTPPATEGGAGLQWRATAS